MKARNKLSQDVLDNVCMYLTEVNVGDVITTGYVIAQIDEDTFVGVADAFRFLTDLGFLKDLTPERGKSHEYEMLRLIDEVPEVILGWMADTVKHGIRTFKNKRHSRTPRTPKIVQQESSVYEDIVVPTNSEIIRVSVSSVAAALAISRIPGVKILNN